jgi:hypothetical protein
MKPNSIKSRRKLLKRAGAAPIAGPAGCSGQEGDDGSSEGHGGVGRRRVCDHDETQLHLFNDIGEAAYHSSTREEVASDTVYTILKA